MNIKSLLSGIADVNQGVNIENPENNKIINEAIILEALGNNKEALLEFYDNIGTFGSRDGILNESAAMDIKINSFDVDTLSETASILTIAKECNSKDYELYKKSVLLMEACMDNMKQKYSDAAEARLAAQKAEVLGNARVQDALNKVNV